MTFRCNICNHQNELGVDRMQRDAPSCDRCGSSTRLRAMMNSLTSELFGTPIALVDVPVLKSVRGLGLSDERECAAILGAKFDYRNTFYHQEPRFDVTRIPANEHGTYDFILAGEVFEHVPPPVQNVLTDIRKLLKPGGFLVLTVPFSTEATTREHFPAMKDYRVVSVGESLALVNRTASGEWQVFPDLVFHGGDGFTVEARLFSEAELRNGLLSAGFIRVQYMTEEYAPFGIVHEGSWGVPVVAGHEPFRLRRESVAELMGQHILRNVQQDEELTRQKNERLRLAVLCRDSNAEVERLNAELEEHGRWATMVNAESKRDRSEIARLQAHEEELRTWARAEVEEGKRLRLEIQRLQLEENRLQLECEERTQWAFGLTEQVKQRSQDAARLAEENDLSRSELQRWEASRWTHLGRVLGLGPTKRKS